MNYLSKLVKSLMLFLILLLTSNTNLSWADDNTNAAQQSDASNVGARPTPAGPGQVRRPNTGPVSQFGEAQTLQQYQEGAAERRAAAMKTQNALANSRNVTDEEMQDEFEQPEDFEEVIIFVTIKPGEIPRDDTIERFINIYNKFQKEFDVKARPSFEGYTKLRGYHYKEKEEFSVAKMGESRVIVGFTERGKVSHIQTLLE